MNMLEKVARTLCEDDIRNKRRHDTTPEHLETFLERAIGYHWESYIVQARKCIMAMREPDEAMLDGAWHQAGESKEMRSRTHAHYRRFYTAMIDATLNNAVDTVETTV